MAGPACVDFTWGHANQGGQHDWPFVMALRKGFFLEEEASLHMWRWRRYALWGRFPGN